MIGRCHPGGQKHLPVDNYEKNPVLRPSRTPRPGRPGLNAVPGFAELCTIRLSEFTGDKFEKAPDLVEATPDTGAYVSYSAALKRLAVKLSKICNDLRLMASGPRCGLHEINLPPMAPGSSIMPGKVNPVIPEVTNQVCFKVIGNDTAVAFAAEAGRSVYDLVLEHGLMTQEKLDEALDPKAMTSAHAFIK